MPRELPLSMFKRSLSYDPDTGVFVWLETRGRMAKAGSVAGTHNTSGHRQIKFCGRFYSAHRLAWLFTYGEWPPKGFILDHINGDPDDNRIDNIRLCTYSQNCQNGKSWGECKYRGVHYRKDGRPGRWRAFIGLGRKKLYLGTFSSAKDAAKAYDAAAVSHFGEFARPNFPSQLSAAAPEEE